MAMGVPVVASNAGSLPEILGDAALLTDPQDAGALAAACQLVLQDEDVARDYAQRGPSRARLYSWERTADLTHTVYRGLVS
jgi:glycosyltransferase involved in cell wall biosynthesis